ncbi:unnamed protein product [Rotaria sordida]|uniref:Uncharacterized protein n=1 Tax=Rotaria sordida TaxID=392033 RepID=A0A815CVC5_9BILA|nr:unnamed protein product [Rotaria sordida]
MLPEVNTGFDSSSCMNITLVWLGGNQQNVQLRESLEDIFDHILYCDSVAATLEVLFEHVRYWQQLDWVDNRIFNRKSEETDTSDVQEPAYDGSMPDFEKYSNEFQEKWDMLKFCRIIYRDNAAQLQSTTFRINFVKFDDDNQLWFISCEATDDITTISWNRRSITLNNARVELDLEDPDFNVAYLNLNPESSDDCDKAIKFFENVLTRTDENNITKRFHIYTFLMRMCRCNKRHELAVCYANKARLCYENRQFQPLPEWLPTFDELKAIAQISREKMNPEKMVDYLCHVFNNKEEPLGLILEQIIAMLFFTKFDLQTSIIYLNEFLQRQKSMYPKRKGTIQLYCPIDYRADSDGDDDDIKINSKKYNTFIEWHMTGIMAMHDNDFIIALEKHFKRAITEIKATKRSKRNMFLFATTYSAISECAIHTEDMTTSKKMLRKARHYLRKANIQQSSFDVLLEAFVYIRSGALCYRERNYHQAIEYFQQAINVLEKKVLNKLQQRLKDSVTFTRTIEKEGHPIKTITIMTMSDLWEIVMEFTKQGSPCCQGQPVNNDGIGWYFHYYEEKDTAVRQAVFDVLNNHRIFLEIIAILYNDLAWCYLFTGRPLLAIPYIYKIDYIYKTGLNSIYYLAYNNTLICLSMVHLALNNFDNAIKTLNMAITLFKFYSFFDQHRWLALLYVELGDVYTLANNSDQLALESYTKAMNMLSEMNDEENATDIRNYIEQKETSRKFVCTTSYEFRKWLSKNKARIVTENNKTNVESEGEQVETSIQVKYQRL